MGRFASNVFCFCNVGRFAVNWQYSNKDDIPFKKYWTGNVQLWVVCWFNGVLNKFVIYVKNLPTLITYSSLSSLDDNDVNK